MTLSDAFSSTLQSATVSITGNFHTGDELLFVNDGATMGDVIGSYNAGSGVLTLSSAGATLAQFQAALRSVSYTDLNVTPDPATRTISFTANDGTNSSAVATRTVTVADVDQTPVVSGSGQTLSYLGNSGPAALGGLTVSDLDNATLASGTVSIGSGFQPGDVLGFSNTSNTTYGSLTGAYDAGTGVLTLSSAGPAATLAQWQAALDAITFASTSEVAGSRSVAFTVSDGSQSSAGASKTVQVVGSTVSGNTVAITAAATVSNTLTLPPGPCWWAVRLGRRQR